MTSRKPIVIVSGYTNFTGRFVAHGWTVQGNAGARCHTLKDAKTLAGKHSASGKWKRTKQLDGRHMRTYYTEIMEQP
jgi:hypothetical protein